MVPELPLTATAALSLQNDPKKEGWDWNHKCPSKLEVCCKLQHETGLHQDAVDENIISQ